MTKGMSFRDRNYYETPHIVPHQSVQHTGSSVQRGGEPDKCILKAAVVPLRVILRWEKADVAPRSQDMNVDDRNLVRPAIVPYYPGGCLETDTGKLGESISQNKIITGLHEIAKQPETLG